MELIVGSKVLSEWTIAVVCCAIGGFVLACNTDSAPRFKKTVERGMMKGTWTHGLDVTETVAVSWSAIDYAHGHMIMTLGPKGEHFDGAYAQIMETGPGSTHDYVLQEVHRGWAAASWSDYGWGDTGYVEVIEFGNFFKHYSGRVLATLSGTRGRFIRCELDMIDPRKGLLAGGAGDCQVSDGGKLKVTF
jgi:hypothetical protein